MWIFILIFIILILIICVFNHNKKKECEATKRRERLYREEASRSQLQARQPQQNNAVASRCGKTQTSSTQPKKKYNIPPAE